MGIIDKINELFKNEYLDETITFEMLQELPLYEWHSTIQGIKYMKVFDDGDLLMFSTTIKKGASFGLHKHDCFETCFVCEGFLKDRVTKLGAVTGESLEVLEYIPHEPYAVRDTVLSVTFRKNRI